MYCKNRGWIVCFLFLIGTLGILPGCFQTQTRLQTEEEEIEEPVFDVITVGDITDVANVEPVIASGVGLVTGLDGTGGGTPPGTLKTYLENELRKRKVRNPKTLLSSPNNAMVIVTGIIQPGARKGDPIDVDISLPPHSKVTSLRGGFLQDCYLRNYETTKRINPTYQGSERWLSGHKLAKSRGPLMVGLERGEDYQPNLRKGKIWDGGVSFIDRPYYLVLKENHKKARKANLIAQRVNSMFQDEKGRRIQSEKIKQLLMLGEMTHQINKKFKRAMISKEIAKAGSKDIVYVNVPWEYRLNTQRYLRVVRLIPLLEPREKRAPYRKQLKDSLLNPAHTVRAALRLEALGRGSIPTLRMGLKHEHPLVRFTSAEALAYLGNAGGVKELGREADMHPQLRAYCLTAMASLDESICRYQLNALLASKNAESRYGAFRALQLLKDSNPQIKGELLNNSFWIHRVASESTPLVHFSVQRRAEVVLFGRDAYFVPPFRFLAGKEFTIVAAEEDDRVTISRYDRKAGQIGRKQCSLKLEDVLRTVAHLGGQYPDVVDLLRKVEDQKCLSCVVKLNAVPQPVPVEDLARGGRDPDFLKTNPIADQMSEFREQVTAAD